MMRKREITHSLSREMRTEIYRKITILNRNNKTQEETVLSK